MGIFDYNENHLVLSHFAPILPPSVNQRLGVVGGRVFTSSETKRFVRKLEDSLDDSLRVRPMESGQFYFAQLLFVGDFYDVQEMLNNGKNPEQALGNLGRFRPDLDNLIKATLDVVKVAICNDDKWNTRLAVAKVQYPQRPGVIIEVFHANALEPTGLVGQVSLATLEKLTNRVD